MRFVSLRVAGLFATLTVVVAMLVPILLSRAATAIVVASMFTAGVVVGGVTLHWLRRESGSDDGGERAAATITVKVPPVSIPYQPLNAYLERRFASNVVLTFEQIESLVGFALPPTACTDQGWWTDGTGHGDGHADAWIAAGRSATPNLSARTVAFTGEW